MLFKTQLELNITIVDTNAMYATNYEQMLLDHARLMYAGKCRDGQYIKSIDSIVKRSLPNLIRRDLTAKIRIYVAVEATVIRYDPYDFITGAKVIRVISAGKINPCDMVECRNDHAVVLIRVNEGMNKFKPGDVIPVRVGQTMYRIDNTHILVNGFPCLPHAPETVCYKIDAIDEETKAYYEKMIAPLIKREMDRKETLDKAQWKKFAELMHPFKETTTIKDAVSILDPKSFENGVFRVDYRSDLTDMKVSKVCVDDSEIVTEPAKIALTRLSVHFVKWIELINGLTEEYATASAFDGMAHVWDVYRENKL